MHCNRWWMLWYATHSLLNFRVKELSLQAVRSIGRSQLSPSAVIALCRRKLPCPRLYQHTSSDPFMQGCRNWTPLPLIGTTLKGCFTWEFPMRWAKASIAASLHASSPSAQSCLPHLLIGSLWTSSLVKLQHANLCLRVCYPGNPKTWQF